MEVLVVSVVLVVAVAVVGTSPFFFSDSVRSLLS
jgi:hypothetical protein